MKKSIAIFLLVLYLTAAFRVTMPYLVYQVNKDLIASTLCENKNIKEKKCEGKCYLKKELNKFGKEAKKTGVVVFENENIHLTVAPSFSLCFDLLPFFFKVKYPQKIFFCTTSCLSDIFHPPSVI